MTDYISLIIAGAGLIASVYFSQRNIQKQIRDQDARRETELIRRQDVAIERAREETKRHQEIVSRLDRLKEGADENKREISDLKEAVKELNDTQIRNVRDLKTAFDRIDKMEKRLELLHQEHRQNMGKCAEMGGSL